MKKPQVPKKIKHIRAKLPFKKFTYEADDSDNPLKITNETVAEHREKVLSSARKYIYPLQHSKHKIIIISVSLFSLALVGFFTYCTLSLYRFKSNNNFLYGVTQVIPFPIAKAGSRFVAYENYLFELRQYIHYYETQQQLDFENDEADKQQLEDFKKRALDKVIQEAYVKQLASDNKLSVSNKELEEQIILMREQNRLGANEQGFEDVLKENFGWTINDFKRVVRQQMLAQKVVAALDMATYDRAESALAELQTGADFVAIAAKYSDDTSTKDRGGEYPALVDRNSRDLVPQITDALFKLQPGAVSSIVNAGYTLEILKYIEPQGEKIKAAHISFAFKDISVYTDELKAKKKPVLYVGF